MNVAALQISSLGLSPNRLDYYFRIAKAKEVKVLLLPEYVLNRFFHHLLLSPKNMIKEQSAFQKNLLKDLSKKYKVVVVAPLVRVLKDGIYKSVMIVRSGRVSYYDQQILIDYPHWNEQKFFANPIQKLQAPPTFKIEGIKFGVIAGFEVHFDWFWMQMSKRGVDVVLVPNVATFQSNERWKRVLQTRAFTNSCYVIRANRVGEYEDKEHYKWKFYGHSLSIKPDGELSIELGEGEELLIEEIDKKVIKEVKKEWGFIPALKKRGLV